MCTCAHAGNGGRVEPSVDVMIGLQSPIVLPYRLEVSSIRDESEIAVRNIKDICFVEDVLYEGDAVLQIL